MTLACTLHGMLDLRLQEETPPAPGPHDVLLRLGAGGICGSDLHYFQQGRVGAFVIREPLVPGHEASGVVAAPWALRSRACGRATASPSTPAHPCGHCDYCRGGRGNLCRRMFFLGSASVFPHAQGMFRERFVMGEAQLTPVDRARGRRWARSPAPSRCRSACTRCTAPVRLLGETVLVTGGGTIGCMCVLAARLAGAARRRRLRHRTSARSRWRGTVGADRGGPHRPGRPRVAGRHRRRRHRGRRPARPHCRTCLHGRPAWRPHRPGRHAAAEELPFPFPANQRDAARARLPRRLPRRTWPSTGRCRRIRSRRVDVRPLITAQLPLSRAREAFELALDKSRSTKVQVVAA
jgi:L-idonate 5-dehydrogenase